ncbi:MAG: zinc ribbon domain-containing protein [Firmicutes bacterium]|nr:zinc ribbon domain-containing protein [Bacillota bacterium]
MPLREFQCKNCGEQFEELVRSDTKVTCPKCKSEEVHGLLSVFGFRSSGPSGGSTSGGCGSCAGGHCSTCH